MNSERKKARFHGKGSVHIRCSQELYDELAELAEMEMRPLGAQVKLLVIEALRARKSSMKEAA